LGTYKIEVMAILQITSREFREKQKSMFDLADKGEKIIIRRGKNKAYTLVALEEEDLYFTPEMLAKIDSSLQEAKAGKVFAMLPNENLSEFLKRTECTE